MESYSRAAVERAMKGTGSDLAGDGEEDNVVSGGQIVGISDRHMRRWRERYQEGGFRALFDTLPTEHPGRLLPD